HLLNLLGSFPDNLGNTTLLSLFNRRKILFAMTFFIWTTIYFINKQPDKTFYRFKRTFSLFQVKAVNKIARPQDNNTISKLAFHPLWSTTAPRAALANKSPIK